ncbi:MAG: purine-nucleoside phosphorylase [Bacteroidota bacterium]
MFRTTAGMTAASPADVDRSVAYLRRRLPSVPRIALVLGSGLGDYADSLPHPVAIPASEIPSYPVSTVEGHKGALVCAEVSGTPVLAFQGRVHFYESNDLAKVLHPVAVAASLGVRTLVITNAAGGINRQFAPGDLMLIADQLDLTFEPLRIPSPSMHHEPLYDRELMSVAEEAAMKRGIPLRRGVYAGVKGPSYETGAEVEMIHRLGGDAVGMSTVKEARLAAALGMRVLGISCITNKAAGIGTSKLHHGEVTEVANRVKRDFATLLSDIIAAL